MRRLAGFLSFVVGALLVIYSASWMLLNYKTQAKAPKTDRKYVLSVSVSASNSPSPIPTASTTPTPVPTDTAAPTQPPKQENTTEDNKSSILDKINAYRASKGLSAASSNGETCSFAKTRAGEISSGFDHSGFDQRINSHNLPYPNYSLVTENIAMTSNYLDVVNIWIKSARHAENMLKDTPFICVVQNGNYFAYEGWKP